MFHLFPLLKQKGLLTHKQQNPSPVDVLLKFLDVAIPVAGLRPPVFPCIEGHHALAGCWADGPLTG